jgi:hypothetical protein
MITVRVLFQENARCQKRFLFMLFLQKETGGKEKIPGHFFRALN